MHHICKWSRTNSVSFCSKDFFMPSTSLEMHQNRFRRGFAPDPTGEASALPQTPSWWGGGSPRTPQEPHPLLGPSGFGLVMALLLIMLHSGIFYRSTVIVRQLGLRYYRLHAAC